MQYLVDIGLVNPDPHDASFDAYKEIENYLKYEQLFIPREENIDAILYAASKSADDILRYPRKKFAIKAQDKKDFEISQTEDDSIFQDVIKWADKDASDYDSENELQKQTLTLKKHRELANTHQLEGYIRSKKNKNQPQNNFPVGDDLGRASPKESNLIKRSPVSLPINRVGVSGKYIPRNYSQPDLLRTWGLGSDIPTLREYISHKELLFFRGELDSANHNKLTADYNEIYGDRASELKEQQRRAAIQKWSVPGAVERHQAMLNKLEIIRNHYTPVDSIQKQEAAAGLKRDKAALKKRRFREKQLGDPEKTKTEKTANAAQHLSKYTKVKDLNPKSKEIRKAKENEKKQKQRVKAKAKADSCAVIEADKKVTLNTTINGD